MRSNEFQLAIAACRQAFGDRLSKWDAPPIDWPRFLLLVRRHRIEALAFEGLKRLGVKPDPTISLSLTGDAKSILARNLDTLAECERIRAAFLRSDLPMLFVKGLALAGLAYPNPFLKMGWDVDILIAPSTLGPAADILAALGYKPVLPGSSIEKWHRRRKESVWSRDGRFFLELHTRLADNPAMLREVHVHSSSQSVRIADRATLETLADEELFAYLCVHGTASSWSRLKWLTDLVAFLHRRDSHEIEHLHQRSIGLGAGRCSAAALLLCAEIFGVPLNSDFLHDLRRSLAVRTLVTIGKHHLSGKFELTEPTQVTGGTVAIHLAQLLLKPGLPFAIKESIRQVEDFMIDAADRSRRASIEGTA